MVKVPWEAAPEWLREDRTEALLLTHRPRPASKDWMPRVRALQVCVRDLSPGDVRDRAAAEVKAMILDRSRWLQSQDMAERHYRTEDEEKMLWCEMRAVDVRGLTRIETERRKVCFVCGTALTGRRRGWCNDECPQTWLANHEWSAASAAALNRDALTCQRCGYKQPSRCAACRVDWPCKAVGHLLYPRGFRMPLRKPGEDFRTLEVNHMIPRVGRGYSQGCHHHLVDLETLCHPCHVAETTRQGRERRGVTGVRAEAGLFD